MSWVNPLLQEAAVFLIAAFGYFFFFSKPEVKVETTLAEKTELYLPDSSFVILNAASKIAYTKKNWEEGRYLELNGEAYFKVQKGSNFEVKTEGGTVSVLGTEFNVKYRKDYFDVICYEGLVKVETAKKVVNLSASQGLRIVKGEISEYEDQELKAPTWTGDQSTFRSVPFEEVVKELERQYNLTVKMENVDAIQLFTGGFAHNDLDLALKSITLPLNLSYTIEDNKHVVLSSDNQ